MAEYTLENGYKLSDEEIEKRAAEWEDGSWAGDLVTLRVGRPRLSEEGNKNLSFKCPIAGAELIQRAADAQGIGKSEFLRSAALEKAAHVLALN
jgi:hypothetical protein